MRSLLSAFALLIMPVVAVSQTAVPGVAMSELYGHYEFGEEGMTASADLRPDGTFTYRIDLPDSEREKGEAMRWDGVWRTRSANKIVLENAPGVPPRLVQTGAVRDASVRAAVTITGPAERMASEIALVVDEGWPSEEMSAGRWIRPLASKSRPTAVPRRLVFHYTPESARGAITLGDVALTPGGPNRFTFAYTPSTIMPFYVRGNVVDLKAGVIALEAGQAGLPMRRTGPALPPS